MLLDQRLIVYLFQERRSLFIFGRGGDEVLIRFQIEPLLVSQHMVPDVPAAAEGVFKQLRLGLGGVEPDFKGGVLNRFAVCGAAFFPRHVQSSLPVSFKTNAAFVRWFYRSIMKHTNDPCSIPLPCDTFLPCSGVQKILDEKSYILVQKNFFKKPLFLRSSCR